MHIPWNFICRNYLKIDLKLGLSREELSLLLILVEILPTCNSNNIFQRKVFLAIDLYEKQLVVIYSYGRFIYPIPCFFFFFSPCAGSLFLIYVYTENVDLWAPSLMLESPIKFSSIDGSWFYFLSFMKGDPEQLLKKKLGVTKIWQMP